jgi:hypothetical protein
MGKKTTAEAWADLAMACRELRDAFLDALWLGPRRRPPAIPEFTGRPLVAEKKYPEGTDPQEVQLADLLPFPGQQSANLSVSQCEDLTHYFDTKGGHCRCGKEYWPTSDAAFNIPAGMVYATGTGTITMWSTAEGKTG